MRNNGFRDDFFTQNGLLNIKGEHSDIPLKLPFYILYRDADGTPSADNPWYNKESNIPNKDLQWGYDFNHQSTYTRALVDSVAGFWMKEYKVDGFRYDFTKGFSNTSQDTWANKYDTERSHTFRHPDWEFARTVSPESVSFPPDS